MTLTCAEDMNTVILINGSINSGKTTVSYELKRLLPRTAHIEVDDLRNFIDWIELEESVPLNLKNTLAVGKVFLEYGLNVVISYPLSLEDYEFLKEGFNSYSVYCFTLCPPLEIAITNRGSRELTEKEVKRIPYHYESGISNPEYESILIDNSDETPVKTALQIVEHLSENQQTNRSTRFSHNAQKTS